MTAKTSSRSSLGRARPPLRASKPVSRALPSYSHSSHSPMEVSQEDNLNDSGGIDLGFEDYGDSGEAGVGEDVGEMSERVKGEPAGSAQSAGAVVKEEEETAVSLQAGVTQQKLSLTHTTKKLKKSSAALAREKAAAAAAEGVMPLFKSDPSMMYAASAASDQTGDGDVTAVQVSSSLQRDWWCKTSDPADGTKKHDYVPMYWTDATETNGTIYLFGRVAVVEPGTSRRFLSCCVAVHGSERNLFVLPKKVEGCAPDGTQMRAGLDKVYADVNSLLVPHVIPRSKGQGFRCKQVKRKYAFEHAEIPREECEYLKVVYSAKHGSPSPAQCDSPPASSSIERIFGATSTALELFLLKRKLMGPSWIYIKNPIVMTDSVSWCKLELSIDVR